MTIENDIKEMKQKLQKAKTNLAVQDNELQKIEDELKENYNIEDEQQAIKRLEEIEKEKTKLEKRKQELSNEIQDKLAKYENV